MPRTASARKRKRGRTRSGHVRLPKPWPAARTRKRLFKALGRAPAGISLLVTCATLVVFWLAINWIYQVVRKPSELFFPVSGVLYRTPSETWAAYDSVFRRHSTHVITPEFLAALAQVEGSGNPIVRTYWRWSLSYEPFEVYRPASSAVGMYQITDGTFAEARRYCIRDHVVIEDGPWHDWRSCWFNSLYTRVIASHSVEMTSAYLDRKVARALARAGISAATPQQKQNLAAVIHLCGAGAGERFARRGLQLLAGQRCGDHDVRAYVSRVQAMKRVFTRLGAVT